MKPGAAGDEDPLAVQSTAASLRRATLSPDADQLPARRHRRCRELWVERPPALPLPPRISASRTSPQGRDEARQRRRGRCAASHRGHAAAPRRRLPEAGRDDEPLRARRAGTSSAPRSTAGPAQAVISGSVRGPARLGRSSSQRNGCEIARWKKLAFLVGGSRRAAAPPPLPKHSTETARIASPPGVRTVLFVGAGRHQRRAILRARELGLRVVAVDRNPDAPGLAEADAARWSTSATSPPSPRSAGGTGSTACSPSPPTAPCPSSPPSPRRSACRASASRRRT